MNLTEFKSHLTTNPDSALRFVLPDGDVVPAHFHITEVGRIDKTFIDCGGTVHRGSHCQFQVWVADDTDHRFWPRGLAKVLDSAAPFLQSDDLPVEVEYEDCSISQYPVESVTVADGALVVHLREKHTDCLAKSVCLPGVRGVHEKSCC